jgi:hypothetical protein
VSGDGRSASAIAAGIDSDLDDDEPPEPETENVIHCIFERVKFNNDGCVRIRFKYAHCWINGKLHVLRKITGLLNWMYDIIKPEGWQDPALSYHNYTIVRMRQPAGAAPAVQKDDDDDDDDAIGDVGDGMEDVYEMRPLPFSFVGVAVRCVCSGCGRVAHVTSYEKEGGCLLMQTCPRRACGILQPSSLLVKTCTVTNEVRRRMRSRVRDTCEASHAAGCACWRMETAAPANALPLQVMNQS